MDIERELTTLRRRLTAIENAMTRRYEPTSLEGVPIRVMFVTEDIPAMAGDHPGKGKAVEAVFDGTVTPATLVEGDGDDEDIYNGRDKKFFGGAVIMVADWADQQWVIDPGNSLAYGTVGASTISSGGSGGVNLVAGGTGAVTAVSKLSGSLAPGTKVFLASIAGAWFIISADCP